MPFVEIAGSIEYLVVGSALCHCASKHIPFTPGEILLATCSKAFKSISLVSHVCPPVASAFIHANDLIRYVALSHVKTILGTKCFVSLCGILANLKGIPRMRDDVQYTNDKIPLSNESRCDGGFSRWLYPKQMSRICLPASREARPGNDHYCARPPLRETRRKLGNLDVKEKINHTLVSPSLSFLGRPRWPVGFTSSCPVRRQSARIR